MWKFNNSLLYDSEYVNRVKKCVKETVEEYKIQGGAHSPESIRFSIDDQLFFETLKLQIRGTTIPYAAGKKRERIRQEKQIEEEINILQKDVDEKHSQETNNKLKSKQMELQKIREYKMRSRVNWAAKGEKNSKHFLSLERRNYTNKIMTKLILDNNEEITSQEDVIKEQTRFYKTLYTSKEVLFNECHSSCFFNHHRTKLSDIEKESCEGKISLQECHTALKAMSDNKCPGIDGFTPEFYKFFWNDTKIFQVRSLNASYDMGKMSITQRRGVITSIPKPNKIRFYLKNWRPISLICVDYKIASTVIANRLKIVLPSIISETQKGFLKNRCISENTRLLYDLMQKLDEEEGEGPLLLVDFEKAFDSLEWLFIERALNFFNFGESLRKWVKVFYTDIMSTILYNGHLSTFFPIERGVRQGDALSPYLFLICVELLADGIKANTNVKGIKTKDTEFLNIIGQYADDTFFTLDGSESSLQHSLNTLELYAECSGLKVNI